MTRNTDNRSRSRLWKIFRDHPVESGIVTLGVVLLLFSIIGLSNLDPYQRSTFLATLPSQLMMALFQAVIFAGIYAYMFRGSGLPFTGNRIKTDEVNTPLTSVIGLRDVKEEIGEIIAFMNDHSRLSSAGGRLLNGILFTGDPGTGKTLMAKAIATECGLPFIGISGAGFVEMFVGVGASRVRELFKRAGSLAEEFGGCIIFIDEFDALAKSREYTPYGSMEDNRTINQFLEKMDGVARENRNILVIAATNASIDSLDPAITRPGRFDRHIQFSRPNLDDRIAMLEFYTKEKQLADDVDLAELARSMPDSSGADIENTVNEALLICLRRGSAIITSNDFNNAVERLRLGIKRRLTMSDEEKRIVAIHESGHAIAVKLFSDKTFIYKLSIVPRTGTLGVSWSNNKEERCLMTARDYSARIKVLLGGYAAENTVLGETSDGVTSDFKEATRLAKIMATQVGMGSNIGYFSAPECDGMSETFRSQLDADIQMILREALNDINSKFQRPEVVNQLTILSDKLMEKEELDKSEVEEILSCVSRA